MHETVHALIDGCSSNLEPLCKKGRCTRPTCEDARPYCYELSKAGRLARVYCPVTCGCLDAFSAQLYTLPSEGCPTSCIKQHAGQLAARPCADAEVGSAEITAYGQAVVASGAPVLRSLGEAIVDAGCQVVSNYSVGETCVSISASKPLQLFCPVACGCKGGEPYCPGSCPR